MLKVVPGSDRALVSLQLPNWGSFVVSHCMLCIIWCVFVVGGAYFFLYIGRFWFRCFYICQRVETPPGISDGVFVCAFGYYLLRRIAQRWLFRRNLPHYIWVRPRSPSVIPPQDCEAAADINNHEGFYCRRTKGKINIRVNISRHGVCCAQTQVITHSRRNICHCACGKYHKRRCKIQLVPRNLSMGDFVVPLFR
jgi:hypothetical protein